MPSKQVALERKVKCDECQNKFLQKWVVPQKRWSQINEVAYWTGGKNWNNNKLVCRSCLKNWFENHRTEFARLIDPKKQKTFTNYKGYGVFDKSDYQ